MQSEFGGLREWQASALREWLASDGPWLCCATPGAGKTRFASRALRIRRSNGCRVFAVVVCPTDSLKDQWAGSAHAHEGLNFTTTLRSGECFPSAYDGACVTYAQLPSIASTVGTWARHHRVKITTVLDEIHHCSENAAWGDGATRIGECSDRVMALSGTPFRSDGEPIPFVTYDAAGFVVPQFSYTYAEAIADGVCRRVQFTLRDAVVRRKWSDARGVEERLWSLCTEDAGSWLQSGLVADGDAALQIVNDCWIALQKMIEAGDTIAACGLHCMSSGRNDLDDKYVNKIAKLWRRVTGMVPAVVHHGIQGASQEIERFRESRSPLDRCIISIRQFGEGVDIPRCRVGGFLSNISSPMYLRQVVGRYVRNEDRLAGQPQYAVFVMPDVPVFRDFAQKVEEEARVGLQQAERSRSHADRSATECTDRPTVQTVSVTPEGGRLVMSGDSFSLDDYAVQQAESLASEFPSYPVGDLARIIQRSASRSAGAAVAERPMHVQCAELRKKCQSLAFRIAKDDPSEFPSPGHVHAEVNKRQGVPYGQPNGQEWIEKRHGVKGLTERLTILRAMLEDRQ